MGKRKCGVPTNDTNENLALMLNGEVGLAEQYVSAKVLARIANLQSWVICTHFSRTHGKPEIKRTPSSIDSDAVEKGQFQFSKFEVDRRPNQPSKRGFTLFLHSSNGTENNKVELKQNSLQICDFRFSRRTDMKWPNSRGRRAAPNCLAGGLTRSIGMPPRHRAGCRRSTRFDA